MEKHGTDDGKVYDDRRSSTDDVWMEQDPGAGGEVPLAPFGGVPVGDTPVGAPADMLLAVAAGPVFKGDLSPMEAMAWASAVLMPRASWRDRAGLISLAAGRRVTEGAARRAFCYAGRKGYNPSDE